MSLVYFPISLARGQLTLHGHIKEQVGLEVHELVIRNESSYDQDSLHVEHGFSMKNKLLQLAVACSFSDYYYTWPGIKHIM